MVPGAALSKRDGGSAFVQASAISEGRSKIAFYLQTDIGMFQNSKDGASPPPPTVPRMCPTGRDVTHPNATKRNAEFLYVFVITTKTGA